GSTKRWITDEVSRLGASREGRSPAARRPFVGGHPIAGVEKSGFESSRPDLFEGQPWVLTIPRPHGLGTGDAGGAAGEAAVRVSALAAGLGARPMVMSPEEHDRLLAVTSHLPYLLSLLVVHLGARAAGSQPALADFVAGGYRDATRLALQDPAMGTDILATNASELEPALRGLAALADDLLQRLSDTNPAAGGDSAHILAFAAEARALRLELGRLKRWP
ncbi:MAG: prephenate dehydrogenase/arogenate dehydrogenase family protein, partial [Bacillota bacterium]